MTETSTYDGQTTVYFQGLWEDTLGVNQRKLYAFNGQVVAQYESAGSRMTSPHGDHLGSVSVVTDANGNLAPGGKQEFDPWGNAALRALSLSQACYTRCIR